MTGSERPPNDSQPGPTLIKDAAIDAIIGKQVNAESFRGVCNYTVFKGLARVTWVSLW